jgi:hypothetical protein
MQGPVTWELVGLIAVIVAGALGLWRLVMSSIEDARETAARRLKEIEDQIAAFKIQVVREYATSNHIEKVEGKLVEAINKLIEEVKLLRDDLVATRTEVRKPKQ